MTAKLGKLLDSLAAGDLVLATRIDRLARSMFELFAIVKKIIDAGDNFSTRETTLTMVRPESLQTTTVSNMTERPRR